MKEEIIAFLSVSGLTTTILLMFCGIPICLQYRRQNDVGDVTGFPFITELFVSTLWLQYSLLTGDRTIQLLTFCGCCINFCYATFYLWYLRSKTYYILQLSTVLFLLTVMKVLVHFHPDVFLLGLFSSIIGVISTGSPLAGLRAVIRNRDVSTLPFLMILCSSMVNFQWMLYGILLKEVFFSIPSGCGLSIALFQLSLFLIFPRKKQLDGKRRDSKNVESSEDALMIVS